MPAFNAHTSMYIKNALEMNEWEWYMRNVRALLLFRRNLFQFGS